MVWDCGRRGGLSIELSRTPSQGPSRLTGALHSTRIIFLVSMDSAAVAQHCAFPFRVMGAAFRRRKQLVLLPNPSVPAEGFLRREKIPAYGGNDLRAKRTPQLMLCQEILSAAKGIPLPS